MTVSINQRIDSESITLIAEDKGFSVEFETVEEEEVPEPKKENLKPRPPIVTVMGHVDHGKTSLLDYIKKTNIVKGEAGGITQHIGAYNVKVDEEQTITFLDTPGHEAFTAMRARGSQVTDIAIIIIAADDGVMPQTIEAINHSKAANVPMLIVISKIDKAGANTDKIKEQLSLQNILTEDWGGEYLCQEVSSITGKGIPELLKKILLLAELQELEADYDIPASGIVVEASLDKGRGYVVTGLVQQGVLKNRRYHSCWSILWKGKGVV